MTCNKQIILDGELELSLEMEARLTVFNYEAEVGIITETGSAYPTYTGETELTPTQYTQTLNTENTTILENITINPIPTNYGLITWNGSTLTVS